MYKKISLFLALLLFICSALFATNSAQALTMSNGTYQIILGDLNSVAGLSSGSGKKLDITVGQTAPGLYSLNGVNYKVRAGFEYVHSIISFQFKISGISATFIDFGTLDANTPVTRTNTLTVTNGSAGGFQVTASENHQLLSPPTGQIIPNTTCDNGLCTDITSGPWVVTNNTSTTYGFGYRCDNLNGTNCASGFTTSTYFKQFSINPSFQTVMSGVNVGKNLQSQITYQVNISGTQPNGSYSNIITYVATPTF